MWIALKKNLWTDGIGLSPRKSLGYVK